MSATNEDNEIREKDETGESTDAGKTADPVHPKLESDRERLKNGNSFLRGWLVLCLFLFLTILLTWPIAANLSKASSLRGDYLGNIWNFWWMRTALFEQFHSPWWTDYLQFPSGISLGRHTLSLVNSLSGGFLGLWVGPYQAINLVILAHFALSGWAFFLLARFLTGCTLGSILAGLIYSFCPFHYFYWAQINVSTLEFLPLAILFVLRFYRFGGALNIAGSLLLIALIAASHEYTLVYFYLILGLAGLLGGSYRKEIPFWLGMRRVGAVGLLGSLVVVLVCFPLIGSLLSAETRGDSGGGTVEELDAERLFRANDLFGFNWVGPPEALTTSWPTMLGYSALGLLGFGFRGVLKQRFWMILGVAFVVLSLGPSLKIDGKNTGIPLPYAILGELPVLSMLRKPDRAFMIVQLCTAILCAFAWKDLAARFARPRFRFAVWIGWTSLIAVETTGVPFNLFETEQSPFFAEVAKDPDTKSLLSLPPAPDETRLSFLDARYNLLQTVHRKKIPQGYTTDLALTETHLRARKALFEADQALGRGDPTRLRRFVDGQNLDLIVLHKTSPRMRGPFQISGTTVWKPFFFVRRDLVRCRQAGGLEEWLVPSPLLQPRVSGLTRALKAPVYEDERIMVFRRR